MFWRRFDANPPLRDQRFGRESEHNWQLILEPQVGSSKHKVQCLASKEAISMYINVYTDSVFSVPYDSYDSRIIEPRSLLDRLVFPSYTAFQKS